MFTLRSIIGRDFQAFKKYIIKFVYAMPLVGKHQLINKEPLNPFVHDFFVLSCFLLCSFINSIVVICCTTAVCMKGLTYCNDHQYLSEDLVIHPTNNSCTLTPTQTYYRHI